MVIGAVIAICLILLVLAFLFPRLSRGPQRGVSKAFGTGARAGSKAPGPLGKLLSKPFSTSNRAANKSAEKGRQARRKSPL
jgi:hypothetical protein